MTELNLNNIQPSVLNLNPNPIDAVQPWSQVSDNYRFLSTQKVVDLALNAGFEIQSTKIARVKRPDKIGFQKHRIDLVHRDFRNYTDSIPRLTLVNSHDRTAALTLTLGFYRMVCENGLMVGDFLGASSFKTLHSGKRDLEQDLNFKIAAAFEAFPKLIETREAMRQHELTHGELQLLVGSITEYIQKTTGQAASQSELIQCRRVEDNGTDLWTITNRIQEAVIKGGYRSINIETGKVRRASKITAIDKDIKVNQFIMNTALNILNNKAA
jgi:hypothetical protein